MLVRKCKADQVIRIGDIEIFIREGSAKIAINAPGREVRVEPAKQVDRSRNVAVR